ncbi:MAG: hypothetical protein JSV49_05875 [Thermoplasmata archaeon]|nr:MAG: hypothetical protein JSV49_05875 [Thermoplasmata archaeon]
MTDTKQLNSQIQIRKTNYPTQLWLRSYGNVILVLAISVLLVISGLLSPNTCASSVSVEPELEFDSTIVTTASDEDESLIIQGKGAGGRGGSEYRASDLFDFDLAITYAIITPESFYNQLVPFSEWKIKKGVPAHIFTLEDIKLRYGGIDTAAKIHNFLTELKTQKAEVTWLLLVGDSELIPSPEIRVDILGEDVYEGIQDFTYSDYYYAGLDSTWDHDNDGIYGEVLEDYDWSAELYVGRLPVSTTAELDIVLDKLAVYEKSPPSGTWYLNAMLVGALMDENRGPNVPDDPDTDEDDGYNDYKDNALKVNEKVKEWLPQNYKALEFYDYNQLAPGNYQKINDTLDEANIVSSFNVGNSIVNLVSHGYENGDGHVEYAGDGTNVIWKTFFDYDNARLSTNGYKLPLVYSSSCTSGNFTEEDDTGLERLITAENGGAIGLVGATVLTYRGEFRENNGSFGNWWLDEQFFKMLYSGDHKPGRILYNLKEAYEVHIRDSSNPNKEDINFQQIFRVNQLAYNYLGDPELSLWTQPPDQFKVEFPSNYQPAYRSSPFSVTVRNSYSSATVEGAKVTIIGGDQYGWATTDSSGLAQVVLEPSPGARYNITVTADNYIPFEDQFEVEAALNLQLLESNLTVDNDRPAKNEEIDIVVKFKNSGKITAPEVELAVYDGPPDQNNRIGSLARFQNILPGEFRQLSVKWAMPGGYHEIYAVVDPEDKLLELNETDNIVYIPVEENNPPIFYKLPVIPLIEDEPYENALLISNYVWDPDPADILTIKIISNSEPKCKVTLDENNYIDVYPEEDWFGTANVTLEISDGINSVESYLLVTVTPANDPPALKSIGNQTMLEDEWFTMELFGYDHADAGDSIYYETDLFDVFPSLQVNVSIKFDPETGKLEIKPDNSVVGDQLVKFRAVDEYGGMSDWQNVTFHIKNTPDPPTMQLEEQYKAIVGKLFILEVIVIDEDKNSSFNFFDDTDLFEINRTTGLINLIPGKDDVGEHRIKITVNDGKYTIESSFLLIIENGSGELWFYLSVGLGAFIIGIIAGMAVISTIKRRRQQRRTESNDFGDEDAMEGEEEDREEGEEVDEESGRVGIGQVGTEAKLSEKGEPIKKRAVRKRTIESKRTKKESGGGGPKVKKSGSKPDLSKKNSMKQISKKNKKKNSD